MRIGIDLGGTKIEAVALDEAGEVVLRHRVDTPRGSYEACLVAIVDLVRAVEERLGVRATVGVATPGALSKTSGLLENANSTHLIGHPLNVDLGAALEREVRVANDAYVFSDSVATRLVAPSHGDSSGVRGAAWLWPP